MRLDPDFNGFFASLAASNVRFLVVGDYAMAAHGHPRFTKDLDVWLWTDPSNGAAMVDALRGFGFGSLDLSADDFVAPDTVIQLGYPPNRIDLITTPDGVDFERCWDERLIIEVDGRQIPFIGIRGLVANKEASGRPQDLVDAGVLRQLLDEPRAGS